MPIYVPPVASIPDTYLPDGATAEITGTSTVGSVLGEYKTHVNVALRYGNGAQIEASGGLPLDFGTEDFISVLLTGNTTFQWAETPQGNARYTVLLEQDGVGGRTVAWPAGIVWPGGVVPVITAAAGALSLVEFTGMLRSSTSTWFLFGEAKLNFS
jgi:hypothetical protein